MGQHMADYAKFCSKPLNPSLGKSSFYAQDLRVEGYFKDLWDDCDLIT